MRVTWSPTARRAALAAVEFIATDRPIAASEWLDQLLTRVSLLEEFPDQGRIVPEWFEASVREVFHEPFRVIYEVYPDRIEVLTLSHFRQELPDRPGGTF